MARKKPTDVATGRAGNYTAPVDTVGMDPAMKHSMEFRKKPKAKRKGIVAGVKDALGIKY